MSRWLRCLICLALICCILVNCSPLRVEATGAGVAAATITGAATVTVSAPMVIGASLIALGITYGTNDDFQRLVDTAVSNAGDWVKDGTVELLQTVNSAGEKAYYAAGKMLDDVRRWVFDSGSVAEHTYSTSMSCTFEGESFNVTANFPVGLIAIWYPGTTSSSFGYIYAYNDGIKSDPILVNGIEKRCVASSASHNYYLVAGSSGATFYSRAPETSVRLIRALSSDINKYKNSMEEALGTNFYSSYDVSLGYLPSSDTNLTDGTSARAWSETYTNNGLYVTGGSNDPDPPDENNGKWFWPLALTLTAAELYAFSQADEWSGKTPQEFNDYTTKTEYEILTRPEVEFGQAIEIAPLTSPSPDTGGSTNPDTGSDGSEEVKTDYTTWFSRLYTSVENIAGKFDEIPNKFQSWISDLKTDIQTQTDKLAEHASNTLAAIQSLPESFAESLADLKSAVLSVPNSIKEFFTPKQPSNHTQFALGDLSKFFPFCIPFDLFDFFTLLNADPVAPVFSWEIEDLSGQTYSLTIDLAEWDPVALLFRRLQLFLFICGLAAASRKFIKW